MDNSLIWLPQFFGRLHPLIVHFPIGLIVVAFLLEGIVGKGERPGLREGINWMIYIGGFTSILSAIFGYLLFSFDDYSGELVKLHQKMGVATAVLSLVTALLLYQKEKEKITSYLWYRTALFCTVIAIIITGHLGARITHGEGFFSDVLPWNRSSYFNQHTPNLLSQFAKVDTLSRSQQDQLNLEVRQILAHNCYQCHNESKQKGKLILDNKRGVYQGGESGPVIVVGSPETSELYRRISLPKNHDDVMPRKGKILEKEEIALIHLWIKNGAHWSDRAIEVFPEAPLSLTKPDLPDDSKHEHPIDQLVNAYFEKNRIDWPEIIDDRVFIRRAYLDIIGLLPSPEKIEQFINIQKSNKREILIDSLLNDNQNYTQHWLSFWNDLLRNDYSGPGFITGGRIQITDWLYKSLEVNKPYDDMVRELINPTKGSEGFIKGIQWRGEVNASQRTEMQAAQNIGQSLLGINVKCASCHNSFVSNLTLEQSYGLAAIFSEEPMELHRCDMPTGKIAVPEFIYKELGSVEAASLQERIEKLSDVIVQPANGRLYRTITNRIWKRLMGRGIVEPVDEMDRPPWNAALLDWLAADFRDAAYNLKHLIRMIMTSNTYQLAPEKNKYQAAGYSNYVFTGPSLRRLSAEQFSDAVSQLISPMYYATAYNPSGDELSYSRIWHEELQFDRNVLPEPGKRYFRKTIQLEDIEIETAQALISVDHSYTLHINGSKISEGKDWKKVDRLDVKSALKKGENIVAIEGTNEGPLANPAGILFALKINYKGGQEVIFNSKDAWKSTADTPHENWINVAFNDKAWASSRDVGYKHWGKLEHFTFKDKKMQFTRASLVEQHAFMKALGRPTRENVTTTRNEQATLLQALELTNGEFFNAVLQEGAATWLTKYGNNSQPLIDTLFQKLLGRNPNQGESKVMLTALGNEPDIKDVQDLFWATLLLPEFQFIY